MQTINEESTGYLTVKFFDKAGALAAPSSVVYRIDDVATGLEVRADTAVGSPGSEIEIVLTPADNTILNTVGDNETRRVTVTGTYGPSDQVTDDYLYEVRNLKGITT